MLGTRLLKRVSQTDLFGFKNSDQITKSASESVLGAASPAKSSTSPAKSCNAEVVTFRGAVGMLKEARDRVHQRIVAQQLMATVNGEPESDSELRTKSAAVRKTCSTSVDRLETHEPVAPFTKHSLAMMQPDPLRSPSQAPPQPQYPAAQMAQPSMTNSAMSQVGQPMHGAAPAVNAHGGPALAGQVGTPGTGLDAPRDTRAAAMPGARRSPPGDLLAPSPRAKRSLAVSESDRLRSLYNPSQHPSTATSAPVWTYIRRRTLGHQASTTQPC